MTRVSIVVPVYNEGGRITAFLDRLFDAVTLPCEVLAVYDRATDTTVAPLEAYRETEPRLRPVLNTYGPGPAAALRFGVDNAESGVVVVTMADGSDDPLQIDQLALLVEGGAAVAAASRYMRGGRQLGGPWLKGAMSSLAGRSLHLLGRVGTHDATNSFKAYSREFVSAAGIESDAGFTLGIEMIAKAKHRGLRVAEIPTVWRDRTVGTSNFRISSWLGRYLRWYVRALRPGGRQPGPR
jgi:glycosyltransferase involved in cell wall biosynthesis